VEDHALVRDLGLQLLDQMPRDGLALAVFIRCQDEFVDARHLRLQVADGRLLVGLHHVEGLEVLLDVDAGTRPFLALVLRRNLRRAGRQVADVAARTLHHVVGAEHAGERARLRGRLDDDEFLGGSHFQPSNDGADRSHCSPGAGIAS